MAEIERLLGKDAEKQVKDLLKLMEGLTKGYESAFQASKKLDDQIKKLSKSTDDNKKKKEQLTAIQKEEARILKATATTKAKIEKIRDGSVKLLVKNQQELQKRNKELKNSIALENKQLGTLEKLALQNQKLNTERKKLNLETKKGQLRLKEINKELDKNNRFITKNSDALTKQKRGIGKYSEAIKGVVARFIGWGIAIAAVTRAFKSGFNAVRDNSKANAELRGILNKTRKETVALREEQLRLGGATVFTATQVTKAQTELSRLGLSMEQIIELTPAILDGAIAMGVDMAEAAELVAGQLNAFGLAAKDGKRVTDVLVRATQISAFNYIKLKDALRVVSPAAAAVGDSIEDVVSKLTAAVDANIDAGTASTALRNIYIELAKSGLSWDDAMTKINTSTNKLSTANDLFGKRGAVVAIALADNTEKINENKIALDEAAGSAEAFAKAQKDNLTGDQLLWTSAWEGFFQQLNEGNSLISEFTRGTIQAFTAAMQGITRAMAGTNLETVLWEERIVTMNLSLEELGGLANRSADEISKMKTAMAEGGFAEAAHASANLADAEKRRVFILDLLMKKIKEANAVIIDNTDVVDDNTLSEEENEAAQKKAAETRKDAAKSWLKLNDAIEGTNSGLSKFGILTDEQKLLLEFTEGIFGKNTIDEDAKEFLEKTGKTIDKLGEIENDARKKRRAAWLKDKKERDEDEAESAEIRRQIAESSVQLLTGIFTGFQDLKQQQLSDESNALELQRQTALEGVKGDKAKEDQINDQFNRKQAVIKQKQWKAEQNAALFQIAIQSGVNAVKAFPNPILIALALALGITQAAFVRAQKPPKFAKGSKGLQKDTHGIVGEAGRELLFMPGGGVALAQKETEGVWPKGTVIKTNKETEQILAANQLKASRENEAAAKNYGELAILSQSIAEDRKSILKAVSERDQYLFEVSKQGIINLSKRNKSGVTTYLNNRFR